MRGYEWGKGTVRCGFCGVEGHNVTTCPDVSRVANRYLKMIEKNPEYVGTWAQRNALRILKNREERRAKLKRPKRKPRCSFCGSTTHRRPKCKALAKFMKKLKVANLNWRKAFVKNMELNGFGIGSLVTMPKSWFEWGVERGEEVTGIVLSYDKTKLNLFCPIERGEYKTVGTLQVLIGTDIRSVNLNRLHCAHYHNESIIGQHYSWYGRRERMRSTCADFKDVDESFYSIDDEPAFEWFQKKISKSHKEWIKVIAHVDRWETMMK